MGLDSGEAYKEIFGQTNYVFDHKGVHFIAIDNVSNPSSSIGDSQLKWLEASLKKFDKNDRIVVLTHHPLFNLSAEWDWRTSDEDRAIAILNPYKNVTVLYGHIHQEHHHVTGNIQHHAAKSTIYPLPAVGSMPKKIRLPWDAGDPYRGLGFREVEAKFKDKSYMLAEYPLVEKKRKGNKDFSQEV